MSRNVFSEINAKDSSLRLCEVVLMFVFNLQFELIKDIMDESQIIKHKASMNNNDITNINIYNLLYSI